MLSFRASQALLLLSALAITPAFASRTHRPPTSGHAGVASSKKGKGSKVRGQRTIDSDRATEIQAALIQKKYLNGAPTGQWDSQTQVAMRQYQSDHGWQTRLTPDSRALISLGLGPKQTGEKVVAHNATAPQGELTTQAQTSEPPAENTLAAVHSLSQ
jgi:peptidoglycan hydrolase-like protein with peptidoglycan-binding domain